MTGARPSHLVVGLEGPEPTPDEIAWLGFHRPAGVVLFSRNINDFNQLCDLCSVLHALVPGTEVMVDHEGGAVSQAAAAVGRPPAPWGLGVLDDAGLTARVHEETGRRLAAAGVDRVLAPVADVLTNPRNPVIGARAFGDRPEAVSRHVVAAVTGLLRGGVAVCVKHWPGHGAAGSDTHRDPADGGGAGHGGPFRAALEAGADAVMAGHLHLAAATAGGVPLPATLDPAALARARADWRSGRTPRVIADDVTMGALAPAMADLGVEVPPAEANGMLPPAHLPAAWFDRLAEAGCDQLLVRGIPRRAFPVPPDGPDAPVAPGRGATPAFRDDPYADARRRLWALAGPGFGDRSRTLAWLDLSSGDRWQAAAGATGSGRAIRAALAAAFAAVRRSADPAGLPAGCDRLLVTAHRPLPSGLAVALPRAEEGVCLAMGHPSLVPDLAEVLGRKWRIGGLFDVSAEDLFPPDHGPTKI